MEFLMVGGQKSLQVFFLHYMDLKSDTTIRNGISIKNYVFKGTEVQKSIFLQLKKYCFSTLYQILRPWPIEETWGGQENSLKPPEEIYKAFLKVQTIKINNFQDLLVQTKINCFPFVQFFCAILLLMFTTLFSPGISIFIFNSLQ